MKNEVLEYIKERRKTTPEEWKAISFLLAIFGFIMIAAVAFGIMNYQHTTCIPTNTLNYLIGRIGG